MIEDQYGNYLVQNVIKLKNDLMNEQIMNYIAGDFIRLSQLKFSSNVIEKALETTIAPEQITQIFMGTHFWDDQLLVNELGERSRITDVRLNYIVGKLVTHIFGNYVLQKVINIVSTELRDKILEQIKSLSSKLQQTKHGQKVLGKLNKSYPHIFRGVSGAVGQPSAGNHIGQ